MCGSAPLPSLWLHCVLVRPLFSQCTSKSLLVQWEFPVFKAGKVRRGSLDEISPCSSNSNDWFCYCAQWFVVLRAVKCFVVQILWRLFYLDVKITWALCSQPEGPHCSTCCWRGYFSFFCFHYLQSRNHLAAETPQYHISTERQPVFKTGLARHKVLGFLEKEQ